MGKEILKNEPGDPANYEIVRLANGASTVRSCTVGETFHPVIGPVAEAEALYLHQMKLLDRVAATEEPFVIWDVGLGAAANVLTVLKHLAGRKARLEILSFDQTLAPLEFALQHASELGYFSGFEELAGRLLASGGKPVEWKTGELEIRWTYHEGDFPSLLNSPAAQSWPAPHAIFFDAFSPARNPAMWTLPLFKRIFELLDPGRPCAMPTYSRSTLLRVTLLLAGFFVGAGHPTGEKEETTIAANTLELVEEPLTREWLERVRRSTSAQPMVEPVYKQAPISAEFWEELGRGKQFGIKN